MDAIGIGELVKLIGNYGMGAVCLATLIVLHLYNVRVTLPNLAKQSREEQAGMVQFFLKEISDNRTSFREELKAEREQCHQDHERMIASQSEMLKALTILIERHGQGRRGAT